MSRSLEGLSGGSGSATLGRESASPLGTGACGSGASRVLRATGAECGAQGPGEVIMQESGRPGSHGPRPPTQGVHTPLSWQQGREIGVQHRQRPAAHTAGKDLQRWWYQGDGSETYFKIQLSHTRARISRQRRWAGRDGFKRRLGTALQGTVWCVGIGGPGALPQEKRGK